MVPDIKKDSQSCDYGIQCTTRIKVPKGSKTLFSTATYRLARGPTQRVGEILWDRVTQHKHNLSYSSGGNVNPFTSTLFKH
jgi:hypothetical protein